MKKIVILLLVVPPLLFAALFGYVLIKGPRMTVQHHFRAFQRIAPSPPPGTVPVAPAVAAVVAEQNAPYKPAAPTYADVAAGRVYYNYYCVFCHGEGGAGNGPVGQSYTPVPADLRLAKVATYNDEELSRRMLRGIGHEPVLERVVPPEHRWRLMQYVRTIGQVRLGARAQ